MAKAYKVADWSFNESKKCFVSWLFCMGRRLLHNNFLVIIYYAIPYYYILYHASIYYTMPLYTIPCHYILYNIIIYYTMPLYTIPYHTIIYYTMPLYTIPGEQEPKKVTAIQLYDMFSPCYSLEGSNAREKEVETVLLDEFLGGL